MANENINIYYGQIRYLREKESALLKGYQTIRRSYEASVRAEQRKMKQSAFDVYEKRKYELQMKVAREIDSEYKSIAMKSEAMRVFGASYRDVARGMLVGEFIVEMLICKLNKLLDNG